MTHAGARMMISPDAAPPSLGGGAPSGIFAQRPGDGGLVKGVLAHAAALVGVRAWTQTDEAGGL